MSIAHEVLPKSAPFLSLKLGESPMIYTKNTPIPVKLYSLKSEKKLYSLSLCRINLE